MSSDQNPPTDAAHRRLRLSSRQIDVGTWVYATVSLMAVLVVYDGWTADIRFLGVVTVVVGPTLALALAHLFAEVLEFHIEEATPPSPAQLWHLAADASQFLFVAIPPLIVLCLSSLLPGHTVANSIRSMLYAGVVSLGFWGWVAGRRCGYKRAQLILPTLSGFLIGLVVIAFQIVLKPH